MYAQQLKVAAATPGLSPQRRPAFAHDQAGSAQLARARGQHCLSCSLVLGPAGVDLEAERKKIRARLMQYRKVQADHVAAIAARERDARAQARSSKDLERHHMDRRRMEIHALNILLHMSDAAQLAQFQSDTSSASMRHSL